MDMYLAENNKNPKSKYIGETGTLSIPRIGERVLQDYIPAVEVIDIIHDYKNKNIYIIIDGRVK